MTTLLEIYNALSTGEDIDIEVTDEVKFKTDVVDETTEEIEGTATVVVTVNSQVTQDIRKRGKKSYQIYSMKIEKIVNKIALIKTWYFVSTTKKNPL